MNEISSPPNLKVVKHFKVVKLGFPCPLNLKVVKHFKVVKLGFPCPLNLKVVKHFKVVKLGQVPRLRQAQPAEKNSTNDFVINKNVIKN